MRCYMATEGENVLRRTENLHEAFGDNRCNGTSSALQTSCECHYSSCASYVFGSDLHSEGVWVNPFTCTFGLKH